MKKKFTKKDEEFQIFSEFYTLTQEFFIPEFSDGYWEELIKALNSFENRHKGNKLCEQMIILMLNYINDKYKENNASTYLILLKKVRFAYKEFLDKADTEDLEILNELLIANKGTTESELLMTIIRQLALIKA